MGPNEQFEREEEDIWDREARGEITAEQARIELRDLQRDYMGAAEEA